MRTIQEFLEWLEEIGSIRILDLTIAEREMYKDGLFLDNKVDLDYDQWGDE